MFEYLVIAGRNHPDLYSYLRRQFTGDNKVQVLLDRRREERRRMRDARRPERRRGDRRGARGRENGLSYHGFVIVHQASGVQWRPPWWGSRSAPVSLGPEGQRGGDDAHAVAGRNLLTGWVAEGQRLVAVVPKLLHEHEQLVARAEAAERKCARCEEEIRSLRGENEHFRRERRQTAETLKALTRQLVESAGGVTSVKS